MSSMSATKVVFHLMMKLSSAEFVKSAKSNNGDTKIAYSIGPSIEPWIVPFYKSINIKFLPMIVT